MKLYIDTTNQFIIFVLINNDRIINSKIINTNRNQSEKFIDELDLFLKSNNTNIDSIQDFFFANGPGSFTGIRVGLSFAKALLVSKKVNIYTINTLHTLVDNFVDSESIIDARGGKYYYVKVLNNKFNKPQLLEKSDVILENKNINTYENSISKIPDNVLHLIENEIYSLDISSLYVKEAF
ncbi:tRNA (adenosine(37)-N6)-threonylcarbamoyltransferase complex dimerization subunit type 1 TsaB [Mycoplasma sp. P36-A1]|uniref:tRNA (adenosine(37)-N6)-threonylcarbamoyltransferase complex dimerization subunit type 1 TsaB n=1 Tax=Mycoplasma sp. P36-A1 TaxID=3252900 RepID=UPI003C2DDE05